MWYVTKNPKDLVWQFRVWHVFSRQFYDKRLAQEVVGDHLGDEFKGYVFKIMGGCDKQGFPMKQGVLTQGRVRLLMHRGKTSWEKNQIYSLLTKWWLGFCKCRLNLDAYKHIIEWELLQNFVVRELQSQNLINGHVEVCSRKV